jgi:hypothetical protein
MSPNMIAERDFLAADQQLKAETADPMSVILPIVREASANQSDR